MRCTRKRSTSCSPSPGRSSHSGSPTSLPSARSSATGRAWRCSAPAVHAGPTCSNPTLSLSVYMFLAPALLWIGAALLLVRLRGRLVAWTAARAAGRRSTTPAGFLLASAGRRGAALNRGLLVLGLLLAFGVNLGIFVATYDQQARIDAQLTLGADVVATAPPGAIARHALIGRVAAIPGATGVSAVDHSYAYVGPDLQDTFGVDPTTLTRGTSLRDSYFLGGSAAQMLD